MNRRSLQLLRWVLAVVAVVVLFWYLDVRSVISHLQSVRWWVAAPALIALTLVHIIAAFTWRHLSGALAKTEMSGWFATRSYYISQALGSVTPGNLGGDAYRVHAMNSSGSGWQPALVPIVVQRVTSYVALAFLGMLATIFVPVSLQFRALLLLVPAAALFFIAATWLFLRFRAGPGSVLSVFSTDDIEPRVFWRAFLRGSLLGLLFHGVAVLIGLVLLLSVMSAPALLAAAAAIAVARVASVLPLTPSGIGVQEVSLALLLPLAGVQAEAAVTFAALIRLAFVLTILVGVVLFAFRGRGTGGAKEGEPDNAAPGLSLRRPKDMHSVRR